MMARKQSEFDCMMFQYVSLTWILPQRTCSPNHDLLITTALITMYNVRRFLQESVYVTLAFLTYVCVTDTFFLPSFDQL